MCRRGICTPISLFLHKETVVPAREKRFTPTVCSRKRSPLKGEKLSPANSFFLLSTAVVQADSRFQCAKAARPFALCAPPPDPLKGVLPAKSKHITRSEHGFVTYRAEICEGRREPLSGREPPGFVSLVSCKTHLARLCQERPPDGGHRLRQQTSGGDPSFSGGYHRLFPQKGMGVHNSRCPPRLKRI